MSTTRSPRLKQTASTTCTLEKSMTQRNPMVISQEKLLKV